MIDGHMKVRQAFERLKWRRLPRDIPKFTPQLRCQFNPFNGHGFRGEAKRSCVANVSKCMHACARECYSVSVVHACVFV